VSLLIFDINNDQVDKINSYKIKIGKNECSAVIEIVLKIKIMEKHSVDRGHNNMIFAQVVASKRFLLFLQIYKPKYLS